MQPSPAGFVFWGTSVCGNSGTPPDPFWRRFPHFAPVETTRRAPSSLPSPAPSTGWRFFKFTRHYTEALATAGANGSYSGEEEELAAGSSSICGKRIEIAKKKAQENAAGGYECQWRVAMYQQKGGAEKEKRLFHFRLWLLLPAFPSRRSLRQQWQCRPTTSLLSSTFRVELLEYLALSWSTRKATARYAS